MSIHDIRGICVFWGDDVAGLSADDFNFTLIDEMCATRIVRSAKALELSAHCGIAGAQLPHVHGCPPQPPLTPPSDLPLPSQAEGGSDGSDEDDEDDWLVADNYVSSSSGQSVPHPRQPWPV